MVTYLAGGGRVQDSFLVPHKRRMAALPAAAALGGDGSSTGRGKIGVKMGASTLGACAHHKTSQGARAERGLKEG